MSFPLRELQFDWRRAIELAEQAFALPPAIDHIRRPERRGNLVQRFALPISLAPTTNRTRHSRPGQSEKTKKAIMALFQVQARALHHEPLPGRPQVLCCRFSSVEPDAYSDGPKMAIDLLCVPAGRRKQGLGLLRDDRPKDAEIVQWWEPAPPKKGFLYIEVRAE